MGRKPIPTALKIVNGTARASRLLKTEPSFKIAIPTIPAHLNGPAKTEWRRVCKTLFHIGVLTEMDRAALAAYCQAYGRWVQAERALAKMNNEADGLVIKTISGNIIQNPLVGTANKAMGDMMKFSVELGMTPSSRTRISAEARLDADPAEKFFG